MYRRAKLGIDKVMLRPLEVMPNHLNHEPWKDAHVGFIRPESRSYCSDVVWKPVCDMAEGL